MKQQIETPQNQAVERRTTARLAEPPPPSPLGELVDDDCGQITAPRRLAVGAKSVADSDMTLALTSKKLWQNTRLC